MTTHDAATVARVIGKSEGWVKRNAPRLPHHRFGRTYVWTDEDIAELLRSTQVRPGPAPVVDNSLRPLPSRRRGPRSATNKKSA